MSFFGTTCWGKPYWDRGQNTSSQISPVEHQTTESAKLATEN